MVWSCLEDGFLVSHAIWQFMKFMGGRSGLRRILPSCTSIIEWCAEAGFPNCTDEMSHRRCKGQRQRIESSSGWKFQMAPMAQPSQPWLLFGRHTSICCASQHGKQDISRSSEEVTRAPIRSTSHEVTRAPIRSTSHEFCKWAAIVPYYWFIFILCPCLEEKLLSLAKGPPSVFEIS